MSLAAAVADHATPRRCRQPDRRWSPEFKRI